MSATKARFSRARPSEQVPGPPRLGLGPADPGDPGDEQAEGQGGQPGDGTAQGGRMRHSQEQVQAPARAHDLGTQDRPLQSGVVGQDGHGEHHGHDRAGPRAAQPGQQRSQRQPGGSQPGGEGRRDAPGGERARGPLDAVDFDVEQVVRAPCRRRRGPSRLPPGEASERARPASLPPAASRPGCRPRP